MKNANQHSLLFSNLENSSAKAKVGDGLSIYRVKMDGDTMNT